MTPFPLVPFINLIRPGARDGYRRETEQEIFERIARTMREDQRRDRRRRRLARVRRIFGGGRSVAPGSRRVAGNH